MKLRTLLAVSLLFVPRAALADPQACNALKTLDPTDHVTPTPTDAPPRIYVTGSSALKPVLAALAPALFSSTKMTVVYLSQGSCAGVGSMVTSTPLTTNDTTNAAYWDPNSATVAGSKTAKEEVCVLPNGQAADIGASDVFAQTCGLAAQGLPAGLTDFQGPIQSMTFAVNKSSKEQSISAQAAYMTFGFANVAPWTDTNFFFRRNSGSGTQSMIATAINVDAKIWKGTDAGGSQQVFDKLTALLNQADIDMGIGILAADFAAKDGVRPLAYQHYGQRCGYKPDVQPLDKKNTREGRYAIWGPLHLFARTDASGVASQPQARDLISYILGVQPPPLGLNLISTEVQLHVVPPCAMKVQRKVEMGQITPFKPPVSCGCAFDQAAVGATTCKSCGSAQDCGATESCNFGFCEAQ